MKLPAEYRKALAQVLAEARKSQGLTQERLSELSGVPPRTLQRSERFGQCNQETLIALANALKTTADALLQKAEQAAVKPERRVRLERVVNARALVACLSANGTAQFHPPGEHDFNAELGLNLFRFQTALRDGQISTDYAEQVADEIMAHVSALGFELFAGTYGDEFDLKGKHKQLPASLLFAAPQNDLRIEKSGRLRVLEYVMDWRKGIWQSALNPSHTIWDWMEDQKISRSDGEARAQDAAIKLKMLSAKNLKSPPAKGASETG